MVDVVVFLQWAVCPSDDPWGALPQVVAHHRLLVISPIEILKKGRGKLINLGLIFFRQTAWVRGNLLREKWLKCKKYNN